MALYMKIPKDMNQIKDKAVWKFTKRQAIYCGIGLALAFATYWLTYKEVGSSTAAVLLFCVGSPFFIIGNYEKNGLTFEKIISNRIRFAIMPKVRLYRSENIYRQIIETIEYNEEVEMLETCRKKVNNSKK